MESLLQSVPVDDPGLPEKQNKANKQTDPNPEGFAICYPVPFPV